MNKCRSREIKPLKRRYRKQVKFHNYLKEFLFDLRILLQ